MTMTTPLILPTGAEGCCPGYAERVKVQPGAERTDSMSKQSDHMPDTTGDNAPLIHVVGARPNFMKLAPVYLALDGRRPQKIVHTGQHYDRRMSGDFFELLGLPDPHHNLAIGSGSHAAQTAAIMVGLEKVFLEEHPRAVIVYGDVNSTLAASLVASKLLIPCVHVEAGLRSGDRTMPEELNRLVTDQLSDALLIHSEEATGNLVREGVAEEKIHFVGNVMIDTLQRMLAVAEARFPDSGVRVPDRFALVTMHRPSNVDDPESLARIARYLDQLADRLPVLFPVHPRTRAALEALDFRPRSTGFHYMEPLDYLTFIVLQKRATVVITDSGGVQEETSYLGTPCLTLRQNTERPVTVAIGTNTLVGENPDDLTPLIDDILNGRYKTGAVPPLWDGQAAERIADVIERLFP